VAPVLLT